MEEKTEKLRDIFLDVAEDETLTESQEAGRGSLAGDDTPAEDRLLSIIQRLREKFEVTTGLDDAALCRVVETFYAGADDEEIADAVGCPTDEVFQARMDLHLVRDEDWPDDDVVAAIREVRGTGPPPGDGDRDRTRDGEGTPPLEDEAVTELATALDVDERTVERAAETVAAVDRSRRVSYRFRTAFEEVLTDADLAVRLTEEAHDDGLEEAMEGAEVDVEF